MLTAAQIKSLRSEPLSGANKVRRARELAELLQADVCSATKMSQPYLSAIELGKYSEMPLETSRTLATFYGCAIEDLFPSREAVAS